MAHLLCMGLRQKVWVLWSFCKYTLQNLPRLRCLPVCSWLIQKWFPDKVNAQLIAPSLDTQFNCYLANISLLLALCRILEDVVMQTNRLVEGKQNKYSILCSFNSGPSGFGWSVYLVCWLLQMLWHIDSFYY